MTEWLQFAYAMGAFCIAYKLAFLVRQVNGIDPFIRVPFRGLCVLVGTTVIFRAMANIHHGYPVTVFDIAAELAWCALLATTIVVIGIRRKRW